MNINDDVKRAKKVSISDYLSRRGISPESDIRGLGKYSSPFSNDSNPSFVHYQKTNSFYCFSTGLGGDVITLCMKMDNISFSEAVISLNESEYGLYEVVHEDKRRKLKEDFDINKYTTTNHRYIRIINRYARDRKISEGYANCVIRFFDTKTGRWGKSPALGFIHVDKNLKQCGVKMRKIDADGDDRFKARGVQCYYILENLIKDSFLEPILFIVESESSANSLWQYAKESGLNCVVISFGAVTSVPNELPDKYKDIKDKRIIIDYDGSEELFEERVVMYDKIGGSILKLKLEKGQDLNSMYIDDTIKLLRLW